MTLLFLIKKSLLLFLLLYSITLYSQQSNIQDSITLQTKISSNHLLELKSYEQDLDSASTNISLAKTCNNIADLYTRTSYYLRETKYDSINFYTKKAMLLTKYDSSANGQQEYLRGLNLLGSSYASLGYKSKALSCFNIVINLTEKTPNLYNFYEMREWATTEIAILYAEHNNFKLAINKYKSLLNDVDENKIDKQRISSILFIKLASFYRKTDQLNTAFSYANKARLVAYRNRYSFRVAMAYIEMASIKLKSREYDKTEFFISKAFNLLKDSEYIGLLTEYYKIKSILADKSGDLNRKLYYTKKAFQLLQKQKISREYVSLGSLLSEAYKETGEYKEALKYLEKARAFEKVLTNNEEIKKNTLVEIQKRDNKIKLEQTKNKIIDKIITIILLFHIIGFVTAIYIFKDSTKKIRLVKLVKQKNEELKELSNSKSNLFYNISHELRTPLTLISGPINQILEQHNESLDLAITSKLLMIKQNVKSLKILINNIMDLSKLEDHKLEITKHPIKLESFLKEITGRFIVLSERNKINFEVCLKDLKEHIILIDAQKLEKIINNLLSNAFKYTPAEKHISLIAFEQDNHLNIIVQDTGFGISKEDLPKIFDRYFQSSDITKPLEGGTGIGLSLVKELIALMNGEINAESQLGSGSIFRLTLPITEALLNNTEQLAKTQYLSPRETILLDDHVDTAQNIEKEYTIMIVEDHSGMQDFITSILDEKYTIIMANNGNEALKLLSTNTIDLIISDIMMPVMDGFTLLKAVKQSNAYFDIPVILLTALIEKNHKLKALTIGVDDYLTKPFDAKELLARAHNLISRYQKRKKVKKRIAITVSEASSKTKQTAHQEERVKNNYNELLKSKDDIQLIKKVSEIIEANLENPEFKLCDLSKNLYLGERQLRTKIKSVTGLSPKKFQQEIVLQKARKLLENETYGNIKAVALSVGMTHVTRFSRLYEARFGKHPALYFKDIEFSIDDPT